MFLDLASHELPSNCTHLETDKHTVSHAAADKLVAHCTPCLLQCTYPGSQTRGL